MAKSPSKRARPTASRARFVLDCSVVFAWFFADESSDYADAVAASFVKSAAIVPSLWALEVANTLLVGERRGRSTAHQASTFLARLASLPITLEDQSAIAAWSGALPIARDHHLSAYDAAYLELALREGLPLATLDDKLQAAAKSLGIKRHVS